MVGGGKEAWHEANIHKGKEVKDEVAVETDGEARGNKEGRVRSQYEQKTIQPAIQPGRTTIWSVFRPKLKPTRKGVDQPNPTNRADI